MLLTVRSNESRPVFTCYTPHRKTFYSVTLGRFYTVTQTLDSSYTVPLDSSYRFIHAYCHNRQWFLLNSYSMNISIFEWRYHCEGCAVRIGCVTHVKHT